MYILTLLVSVIVTSKADDRVVVMSEESKECYTIKNERGRCVIINECQIMLLILKKVRDNRSESDLLEYLRRSTCGFEGKTPMVCCPSDATRSRTISVLPSPPNCGKSSSMEFPKIVGGSPAELGQWPWIVALGYRSRKYPYEIKWLCGGSLVTEKFVLTAAHCLTRGHPILARVGDLDLNDRVADGAEPQESAIAQIIQHRNFNLQLNNDIALIKLSDPIIFTDLIQPICLPKTPELRSDSFVRYSPFAIGWGSLEFKGPTTTRLQMVYMPVVDNEECARAYALKSFNITNKQLCAGTAAGDKDSCQGDSGGPLMLPKGEYFYQIGIVSYGFKCARKGFPGVYTRVTEYIDWISENINAN